jgi:indolepyruvate decarboxylase
MATDSHSYTVGQYLVDRLHELGVRHLFAVPGPHCAEWLHHYVEESSALQRFGTTNALNAGYAADGYARMNGIGAVCVSYSVGAFGSLNAIAGAFVERVPVVVINGAPSADRASRAGTCGGPPPSVVGDADTNRRVYEHVTCAAEHIADPERAPDQIDQALRACLRARRPVYLEPREDVFDRPCARPEAPLSRPDRAPSTAGCDGVVDALARDLRGAEAPVVWGGAELQRYGLEEDFEALVRTLDVPYVTSFPGKGLLPEDHPHFAGILDPSGSPPAVRSFVEEADYVLGLGVGPSCDPLPDAVVASGAATLVGRDGTRTVPPTARWDSAESPAEDAVDLRALLSRLRTSVVGGTDSFGGAQRAARVRHAVEAARPRASTAPDAKITYQGFYDFIAEYVGNDTLLMSGTGLDRLGALTLPAVAPSGFVSQAIYGDAGYVTPAAIGAELASDCERVLVFVGDGGFQMTAQCVGTMAEKGTNAIIFVLNNGVYGSEQRRTNPGTFERGEAFFPQAILQHWHYRKLPDAMGGEGWRTETYGQLKSAVEEAFKYTGGPLLIDVRVQERSLPALAAPTDEVAEPQRRYEPSPAASLG